MPKLLPMTILVLSALLGFSSLTTVNHATPQLPSQVELSCSGGQQPLVPLQTVNPATGKLRQYGCIDSNGNLLLDGVSYAPNAACGGFTCDLFNWTVSNSCLKGTNTDAGITFGNFVQVCDRTSTAVSGGTSGSTITNQAQSKPPAVAALGAFFAAIALGAGVNSNSTGVESVVSDDPLDASAGPQAGLWGVQSQLSLTRASGSIAEFVGFYLPTPINFNGGGLGAETIGLQDGFRIQDMKNKGTTRTAGIQIDAQTLGANQFAIHCTSGCGPSLLDSLTTLNYKTQTNCSSSASPAVCGSAPAGSVTIAAAATTIVVNTTAVTANSQILLARDDSLGTKLSVTCNTATVMGEAKISARTPGTSFTITVQTAPAANPGCFSYSVVN